MDLSDVAFFGPDPDGDPAVVVPTELARSGWGADHLHGVAVSGALARAAERHLHEVDRGDLQPARWTVDLFRPATSAPCHLSATTVRAGRRLVLVDVVLTQGGEPHARATGLFLRPGGSAPGAVWSPHRTPQPPPLDVAPPTTEPRVPFLHTELAAPGDGDGGGAGEIAWSQNFGEHQDAGRKTSWNSPVPIVRGEKLTPWQAAAAIADGASLVTNWGTGGVEYINSDLTLSLARLPRGVEIGLDALDRVEADGVAVGTAVAFDREGPFGTVSVTCLANARRAVDMSAREYHDDGTPRDA